MSSGCLYHEMYDHSANMELESIDVVSRAS